MESKNETIRENGMLLLLAVSPIVIGFFYYVMVQLPIIGMIWMYAAPFTVLYYWGWVATVFRSRFQGIFKTIVWMNGLGIVTYVLYIWQFALLKEGEQIPILAILSQLYTVSLGFITTWIGIVLDGSSIDTETMSVAASVVTETVSILLMIGASAIGYFAGNKQNRSEEAEEEKKTEEEETEAVFSDRQMEDYELKDAEEAQKQNM